MNHSGIRTLTVVFLVTLLAGTSYAETEISLARFFGDCEQADTQIEAAVGEACIIQAIINAFDDAPNGVKVAELPTDWGNYYDRLKALYAGRNAPDVHVMHKSSLPEFVQIGALAALTDDLESAGIDPDDWTPAAREAVTYNGEIYGVPMDLHANLWHINLDILERAGLVHADGTPKLPTSPEELLSHAAQVKETTGSDYLAADFSEFPIGVRLVLTLVWQQGSNLFTRSEATVNTPEVRTAVRTLVALFDHGYANPRHNYADSQQAFLNGEAAVLVNGTWVVDSYDAAADDVNTPLKKYYVASFPTLFAHPATWADTHMWVIPATIRPGSSTYQAALQMLAWINDHNLDWARTGHLAVRDSVLTSEAYAALPHRDEYAATVDIARDVPPTRYYGAIQDILNREFQAIWLTGKPIDAALSDAELAIQRWLDR